MRTVYIIEDDKLLCDLLSGVIDSEIDMEVVGSHGDGTEGLRQCQLKKPDVLVCDLHLPGLNGMEIVQRLKSERPEIRILVVSGIFNLARIKRVLLSKADGIIEKTAGLDEMRKALKSVAAGQSYYSPEILRRMPELLSVQPSDGTLESLTTREREVLQLIGEGYTTKEIATKLNISVRTADVHRTHLMQKLAVHNVAGLTRASIQLGLVKPTTSI